MSKISAWVPLVLTTFVLFFAALALGHLLIDVAVFMLFVGLGVSLFSFWRNYKCSDILSRCSSRGSGSDSSP